MRSKIFFALAALLFSVSLAQASSKIKVGTFPIPLMVEDAKKGIFIELANEMAKRAGVEIEIAVMPPQRIQEDFKTGKLDVMFPALDVLFSKEGQPLKTKEILYIKRDFAFTKKGSAMLKTIGDLEGKTVGLTQGYPYVKELTENKKIKFDAAQNDETNAQKLTSGRFDAFVVEERSGLQAFKKAGVADQIQYDANTPLSEQQVYFALKKGLNDLEGKLSKALADMKTDGTFSKIMSKAN